MEYLAFQQGALVLVHEELWWQPCPSTCNDHEHQQALSGLYLHSGWVCMCVSVCVIVCLLCALVHSICDMRHCL